MSESIRPFQVMYVIPFFAPIVIEDPANVGTVRGVLRMVLEDDVWNAAARGEDLGPVPPLRMVKPIGALERSGVKMPRSRGLDAAEVHERLWTVIDALAFLGVFLLHTDALSDRELYDALREHCLRQPAILVPAALGYGYCVDLMASEPLNTARDERLPRPQRPKRTVLQPSM